MTAFNLVVPATDGQGAAVDVSSLGKRRTITLAGALGGASIQIQGSNDGGTSYFDIATFTKPGVIVIDNVSLRMRVSVANATGTVAANCDVAGTASGAAGLTLPDPGPGGTSAAVQTSGLGLFKTVSVHGAFSGGDVRIQISADGLAWGDFIGFGAPDHRSLQFAANYMRVVRASQSVGAIVIAVGAAEDDTASLSSPPTELVLRPGGQRQDNVYQTWAEIVAALADIDGPARIAFDDSLAVVSIPSGGPYDMSNVTWAGGRDDNQQATVVIVEGATFSNLFFFEDNLFVDCQATATVPISFDAARNFVLRNNVRIEANAGAEFIEDLNDEPSFYLDGNCILGDGVNPVISSPGAADVNFFLFNGCSVRAGAVNSVGFVRVEFYDFSSTVDPAGLTAFATTFKTTQRFVTQAKSASFNAVAGALYVTSNVINANLPPAASCPGGVIIVSPAAALTLVPAGTDRVNSATPTVGNQTVLVSDGVDYWARFGDNA